MVEKKKAKEEQTAHEKLGDRLDVLSKMWQIGFKKKSLTSDYILAYPTEKEKEFLTENFRNAEFARAIIEMYAEKGYRYQWNHKLGDWERNSDGSYKKFSLGEEEKKKINDLAKRLFDSYMTIAQLTIVLARNKKDNFLIKLLVTASGGEEEKEEEVKEVPVGKLDWLKSKILKGGE